jgi:hypothetical protein
VVRSHYSPVKYRSEITRIYSNILQLLLSTITTMCIKVKDQMKGTRGAGYITNLNSLVRTTHTPLAIGYHLGEKNPTRPAWQRMNKTVI